MKTAQVNALNFGMALTPTSDSGYVFAGQDKQFVPPAQVYCYFYVTKIDKCGQVVNRTLFEISSQPRIRSCGARYVKETSDGRFIVTGAMKRADQAANPNFDTISLYVALVDINAGALNWINIYRRPGGEAQGVCVTEAADGFIVTGFVDAEPKKPYIAKLDKTNGNVIWEHSFPSMAGTYSYGNYVDLFSNGDILMLGSYGNGADNNFYAMRFSSTGSLLWSKEYDIGPYDGQDWDVSGKVTQSGGFLISGSTKNGTNYDAVVIKADANGNVINASQTDNNGQDDRARGVTELANGGVVQVGYTDDGNGNVYSLLNKVSGTLTPVWAKVLTLNNYCKGWGINEDVDNGLVFSGETYTTDYDALFVKTDSLGILSGCNYLIPANVTVNAVPLTANTITPTISNNNYFEYAFSNGEKIVAVGSGTTTDFCYNCAPSFVVSSQKVCLNESMYVYSKPIRCSPQSIAIEDSITYQSVAPTSINGDTTFYSFSTAGTYHITLSLTCNGVTQNIVKTLVVAPPPVASAGSDFTKCKYESSPITGTGGASYTWFSENFDSLLFAGNPYAASDTADAVYNVVVVDTNGCIDTADVAVSVTLPHAQFTVDSACYFLPNSFTDASTVASQTFVGWDWDFGDGSPINTTQNPDYVYPADGTYTATLIATTANGCHDTISHPVVVYALPVVDFYTIPPPVGICDGTPVQFNDSSSIVAPYSLEEWSWNFDDATALVHSEDANHLYGGPGTYHVKLIVASNEGCIDSTTRIITINPNPVVDFTADPRFGCEPLCVTFQDASTVLAPCNNVQWLWDYAEGNSTVTSFEHCYHNDSVFAPVTFDITLTVTSDSGCVTTKTKTHYITVYPNPEAEFTVDPTASTVIDPVFTVYDHSIGTNFWHWDYGDSHTDSTAKPSSHEYKPDVATYTITLITSTQYGCYDTASQDVIISPDFTFYIPNAFSPNGDHKNDYFFGTGIGIAVYDIWIFDRWGNMIFHGDQLEDKWDGKANQGSSEAQQDVYVWKVQLTDIFGKKHNYLGTVTLVD